MAGFRVILVACLVALFQVTSAATSHTVGDSSGWGLPSTSTLYSSWAAKQVFQVGDSLAFNFTTGEHTVSEVTQSEYESCTTTGPSIATTTGPDTVTISTPGTHYYICTVAGHCDAGQKLAITTSTSPSSTSTRRRRRSPSSTASSSPQPSSSAIVLVLPFLLVAANFLF